MTPPEARDRPPRIVNFYLAIIVLSWAGNWPLMRLAIDDAPPFVFVLLRLVGAVILLAPALHASGMPLSPMPGERLSLFWVGQLQVSGFLLFAIVGLAIEEPGRAIVLAYTFSLWSIPIGVLLGVERLGRFQLIGAAIGFAGLMLFMNPGLVDWSSARTLLGNGLLLLAAIAWGLGSCLYRRRVWHTGFWTQTFWQVAVSAPVVLVVALPQLTGEPIRWSIALIAILAYNWVVTTALGYFLWAMVLTAMPAAAAGQVLALTPIGGFLLSTAMFGGAVTGDVILSIVLIVAGIILTLRR